MKIKETAKRIHANAIDKGFWPELQEEKDQKNIGELLMLVTSELGEALEAHRKGLRANVEKLKSLQAQGYSWEDSEVSFKAHFRDDVKDSMEDELADAVIRLLDMAEGLGIDLEWHIANKMQFNATREKLHGKAY
jgi:NTP pyrophosphatase (non-canonical NTP hydrolase)